MLNKQSVKSLIQGGQWDEAKRICEQLCRSNPKDADAWLLMGVIHNQFENYREADKCCRKVIALCPTAPVGHFNLGIALQKQRKFSEAASSFRQALKLNPNYAEAHNELGAALQLSGKKSGEVLENYLRAIALNPRYAEAHYNLGAAFRDQGMVVEAGSHFYEAVRLKPGMLKAQDAFLSLLMEQGNIDQAFVSFQEAFRYHPDEPGLYMQYGTILIQMGRTKEALEAFQRVLVLRPGTAKAYAGMAKALDRDGDFEAGYELLRPFLESDEVDADVALAYALLAKHLGHQSQAMAMLERALNGQTTAEKCRALHFALGKLCDEAQLYDQAFAHYRSANDLVKDKFDLTKNAQKFADLKSVFRKTEFSIANPSRQPRATNNSNLPVFIVGMPRSGTSLVEQILSSHPDVDGAGELNDLNQLVALLQQGSSKPPYPYCMDVIGQGQIDEIAERYLKKLAGFSTSGCRVTDKMPHNFINLGLIDRLFPGARVIHCLRDPIDTCLSIYSLPFQSYHQYGSNLTQLGGYYRQYDALMQHWKEALRIPILEVRYEELVANQEDISRQMIEFCGLEWDERCLQFHESQRKVRTFSYDQVRQPLYKKSVARWKNYESHLGSLIAALGQSE